MVMQTNNFTTLCKTYLLLIFTNLYFQGKPPQCDAWIGQCGLYILVMVLEKIAIALLVMLEFWHDVRRFILKPVRKYPKVEVALVMLIIPFIINVSQLVFGYSFVMNNLATFVNLIKVTLKTTYLSYSSGDHVLGC
jgi:hypothetical protein